MEDEFPLIVFRDDEHKAKNVPSTIASFVDVPSTKKAFGNNNNNNNNVSNASLMSGALIGIVLVGVVALILFMVAFFVWAKKKYGNECDALWVRIFSIQDFLSCKESIII